MRSWCWHAVQIVVAVSVLRAATIRNVVFNQDESYIAIQASTINAGGELYVDIVDRKPPLVPQLYAAVFRATGTTSLVPIHVFAILWVAATALVLGASARRRAGPREQRWAAWLFVVASMALLPRDALAANFELWMLLPISLAMLLAGRGNWLGDACAGALVAVAVFMKQPAAVTLAPVALAIWRSPTRMLGLACMSTGFVCVVAEMLRTHDPQLLPWAFFGTGGYLSTDAFAFALRLALVWSGTFFVASAGLWWLVVRSARTRGVRPDVELWVWLVTAFGGVAAGFRFLGHYHLQLLPAACVIAALAGPALTAHLRRRVIIAVTIPAVACGVIAFIYPNYIHDTDYRGVAGYVREHTRGDERILVWGHYPELYWAADRLPAIRFVHTGFLTGHSGARPIRPDDLRGATAGAWDLAREDLDRHQPAYVIDLAPGGVREAQHFPIARFPELAAWLARYYRLETIVDGIWLYRRRD